jgi:hypothetical protein
VVAIVGGGGAAAIAPTEFRINEATLRPGAGGIVVLRDAGGGSSPAPLSLLLPVHREMETAASSGPAEPVDRRDTPMDELHTVEAAGTSDLTLSALE